MMARPYSKMGTQSSAEAQMMAAGPGGLARRGDGKLCIFLGGFNDHYDVVLSPISMIILYKGGFCVLGLSRTGVSASSKRIDIRTGE